MKLILLFATTFAVTPVPKLAVAVKSIGAAVRTDPEGTDSLTFPPIGALIALVTVGSTFGLADCTADMLGEAE